MAEKIQMELEEGVYKIKQSGSYFFMRVVHQNGKAVCSIAGGPIVSVSQLNTLFPRVEIVKKLTPFDRVVNVRVTVHWSDLDRHVFKVESTSARELRKLFDDYPQLLQNLRFPH